MVRKTAAVMTATLLAMLGVLAGKSGARPAGAANVVNLVKSGDTVTATGPRIALAHGIVQVRVTLTAGRITDVTALSLPHDNPDSWAASNAAAVKLRSEVLTKQSADIDVVTGATYTSQGYARSLQAALDVAGLR